MSKIRYEVQFVPFNWQKLKRKKKKKKDNNFRPKWKQSDNVSIVNESRK